MKWLNAKKLLFFDIQHLRQTLTFFLSVFVHLMIIGINFYCKPCISITIKNSTSDVSTFEDLQCTVVAFQAGLKDVFNCVMQQERKPENAGLRVQKGCQSGGAQCRMGVGQRQFLCSDLFQSGAKVGVFMTGIDYFCILRSLVHISNSCFSQRP